MSSMKKISVEELKPGMVFDKSLYIDSSNMLVAANIPIKEDDIKKLLKWGVTEIETAGQMIRTGSDSPAAKKSTDDDEKRIIEDYGELLKKRKKLLEIHKNACTAVESVYASIKRDSSFNTKELDKSVAEIIKILDENYNVFLFLYGLDEGKDYMVNHSVNVAFYSLIIAMALKYPVEKLKEIGLGTILIDAGMMKVPTYIMHKQSNLSEIELNQIKTHPLHGYKALKELGGIKENVANILLQHHEQFDGKGYPRALKGNAIHEYARIAAIADSYEAQISTRSYRKKVYFYHAMRNLLSSGVSRFDPVILRVFLSRMSVYPIGSLVELNDTSIGVIIGSVHEKPLRPLIKLIFDKNGGRIKDTYILSLLEDTSLYITKALDESDLGINIFDVL